MVAAPPEAPRDDRHPEIPPSAFQLGKGPPALPEEPTGPPIRREGAFITVQSLISFPVAVGVVTVIVGVVGWIVPAWRGKPLVFVVAAAAVGLTIYLINETDPLKGPKDARQKLIGFIIAVFNTFVLLSSAVGADAIFHPSGAAAPSAQSVEVNHG